MHLCYVDESGTPDIPGNTSHYILAGISVPIWNWKTCDIEVERIKARYDLPGEEIHVAWLLRSYLEQSRIPGFASLGYAQRRSAADRAAQASAREESQALPSGPQDLPGDGQVRSLDP